MSVLEIVLLIIGILIFIGSFLIPEKKTDTVRNEAADQEAVRGLIEKEMEGARARIEDIVTETISYAMEKSERGMERLSNEKIKTINEYSDTVLNEINRNHQEVIFLYDMLNDKQEELKKKASEFSQMGTPGSFTPEKVTRGKVLSEKKKIVETAEATETTETTETTDETAVPKKTTQKDGTAAAENTGEAEKKTTRKTGTKTTKTSQPKTAEGKAKTTAKRRTAASKAESKTSGDSRNNNEKILELHKAGKPNLDIAKELGLGVGEVKLVIDLFEGI